MAYTNNVIVLGSVIALSFLFFSQTAIAAQSDVSRPETNVPLIDQEVSHEYETATFGLG